MSVLPDVLAAVAPGFQGMLPAEAGDNPNHAADPSLRKQLGAPYLDNPVGKAIARRELMADIEKAVGQLQAKDPNLSRPQAIAQVRTAWASTTQDSPSSTSPLLSPTIQPNQPLSPKSKQDFLNMTAARKSATTPCEATPPQESTPAPVSQQPPTLDEINACLQEIDKVQARVIKGVMQIPEQEPVMMVSQQLVGSVQPSSHPEGPQDDKTAMTGRSSGEVKQGAAGLNIELPKPKDVFDELSAEPVPSTLEDEFQEDMEKRLHPSTLSLLKYLPRRNCIQFFRQSLSLAGLPSWSRWT